MTDTETNNLILLVDGHSLAFRAYYAFSKSRIGNLRTTTGIPTSVCFGFLNSLFGLLEYRRPAYLVVAFDLGEPSFRHDADANYKANRKESPEDFRPDMANLKDILRLMNIPIVTAKGYEADDVLGTLATRAADEGYHVKILTGDRDLFQLVDDEKNISVLYLDINAVKNYSGKGYQEFDAKAVEEKLGVKPTRIVDFKALAGDKSDNYDGVRGIGDKTALTLLQEYDSLDNIYANLNNIKSSLKTKLEEGKDSAYSSKFLAKIALDVPLDVDLENFKLKGFDRNRIEPIFQELELNTFIKKIDSFQDSLGGQKQLVLTAPDITIDSEQLSLFDENIKDEKDFVKKEDEKIKISPLIITTKTELKLLISILKKQKTPDNPVAWDTETTDLNPRIAGLVGLGCCWGKEIDEIAYIPCGHSEGGGLDRDYILGELKFILEGEEYPKVFQNAKFDRAVLYHQGINLKGVVFDTMLASYVLRPELNHNLQELCDRYLTRITSESYKNLAIPKGKTIADLDIETVAAYCGMDAYATYLLTEKLREELIKEPGLNNLLKTVEIPLEEVLFKMEERGIRIDVEYLKQFSKQLEKDLDKLENQAYETAGQKFNLGSPKQLSEILFDKLNLDIKKSRKTKTGYSTDQKVLEKLQGEHEIIDYILEYRTLSKLKSTYVDALPELADENTRVHTDFNQAVTSTGRLSSSNPNLQNIPIRTQFSRQIRRAFLPENGWLLVSADYSQIELRILAHLSQEPILVEAYRNNQDVHRVTARLIFDKEEITQEERTLGKTINFGVIYGMGAQRFARESKLSVNQGKAFIEKYRQRYAKIFEYLDKMKKEAIGRGYVTTILGRKRYFDFDTHALRRLRGLESSEIDLDALKLDNEEAQLLRAAANAPIQGSSADIIKVAMVKLHDILEDYRARLLLQVHDELIFEVPREEWQELQPKIKNTMENALPLSVPLVVDINAGNNWMETK